MVARGAVSCGVFGNAMASRFDEDKPHKGGSVPISSYHPAGGSVTTQRITGRPAPVTVRPEKLVLTRPPPSGPGRFRSTLPMHFPSTHGTSHGIRRRRLGKLGRRRCQREKRDAEGEVPPRSRGWAR